MLALVAGCSSAAPVGAGSSSTPTGPTSPPTTSPPTSSDPPTTPPPLAQDDHGPLPSTIQAVEVGELTRFRVTRAGRTTMDAESSGLARYNTSDRCEVPGQPCYDAPTLDKVARIDLGAPPTVPGKDTTFITGHSNRYQPEDPAKGVFTRLQNVQTGDVLVVTTTKGVFVYDVTKTLTVAFDKLTTTDDVVRVRPDTVVAISCVVVPGQATYAGNYVVVGALKASAPV